MTSHLPLTGSSPFLELHNLPSAFSLDVELSNASSHLFTLEQQVRTANYPSLTSVKKAKRDELKSTGAPLGDNESHTVHTLSNAGHQVLQAPPYPVRF